MVVDEAELLELLRLAPATRAVAYCKDEGPAVYECSLRLKPVRLIASIAAGGGAMALLQRAHQADADGFIDPWRQLPLRYGPLCSMWVLPEHPQSPSMPG